MSEMETKKGKLKIFERINNEIDLEYVIRFIKHKEKELPDYDLDAYDLFSELFYREAIFHNGIIYEVYDIVNLQESDIFESKQLGNGDIEFLVQFYNGGCSFTEALELALDNKC